MTDENMDFVQKTDDVVGEVTFREYVTYRGTTYGASVCYIHFALVQMNAYAVFTEKEGCDKELWSSTKADCQEFLEARGCPKPLAICLLKMADGERGSDLNLPQPTKVIDGRDEEEKDI